MDNRASESGTEGEWGRPGLAGSLELVEAATRVEDCILGKAREGLSPLGPFGCVCVSSGHWHVDLMSLCL